MSYHLLKTFNAGNPSEFSALNSVNLTIEENQVTVLKGPSGSGKTTLLSIVGCMSRPSAGRVKLKGREITSLPVRQVESLQFMLSGFIRKLALASVMLYTVFTALVTYEIVSSSLVIAYEAVY